MQFRRLVLPAPLGPMMAWMSPWRTVRLTSFRARTPPKAQAEPLDDELRCAPREAASVEIVTVPARHAAQNTLSLCESRAKHATPLCEIDCPYAYTRSMSQVDDVPRGTLGTVRNATLLLELLGQGAAFQQLTELAERSGLSLPTVHRLLRSLVAAGLVEQDPDSARYGLGAELVRLAERYLVSPARFSARSPRTSSNSATPRARPCSPLSSSGVRSSTSTVLTAPTPAASSASRAACTPPSRQRPVGF